MKPGDHPEFFRLPPPPGRSRESAIRMDAEGRFWDHGLPIDNPAMQRAFRRWIRRHPDDGRFILDNAYDWTYFTVEDTPFRVVGCVPSDAGLRVRLDDDSEEILQGPVWSGHQGALYARVKGGVFDARFQPNAQASLGPVLAEQEGGGFGLVSGGTVLPVLDRAPEPLGGPARSPLRGS